MDSDRLARPPRRAASAIWSIAKLLTKVADPKDRRAARLYLSELGRDKLLTLSQRYCIAPVTDVL